MSDNGMPIEQFPVIVKTEQSPTVSHTVLSNVSLEDKHSHWLQCLDSDNFSMFIKTWFAFLATVHQLVMTRASEEKQNDWALTQGDKPFLKEYKSFYNSIELNKISKENILNVFQTSRQVVFNVFPQYYYKTYFKKVVPKDFFLKEPYKIPVRRGVSASYELDVKLSEKKLDIGVLFAGDKIISHIHNYYKFVKIEFNTKTDILEFLDDSKPFYDYIRSELNNVLLKNIKDPLGSPHYETMKAIVSAIVVNVDQTLKTSNCHDIIFVPWINPQNLIDSDLKEWFFDFCYMLRNILFHRIIDPFDKNWSNVLKYSHQGLRELLLENIRLLKESEVSQEQ